SSFAHSRRRPHKSQLRKVPAPIVVYVWRTMYANIRLVVMGTVMGKRPEHMTRMLGRLSAVRVQSVRQRGYYGDGGGLYLRVAPGGAKGWIFRYGGGGPRGGEGGWGGAPAAPPPPAGPSRGRRPAASP